MTRQPVRTRGAGSVAGEAGRAAGSIRVLRGWFVACAVLLLISALVSGPGTRSQFGRIGFFAVAVFGALLAAFFAAAAVDVERRPVPWSLAGAIVLTVVTLLALLGGSIPVLLGIITVVAWISVPRAIRLRRIMVENPDLRIVKRFRGEEVAEVPQRPGAELRSVRRKLRGPTGPGKTPWLAVPAVFLVALGAPYVLPARMAPEMPSGETTESSFSLAELDEQTIRFERAWADSSASVDGLLAESSSGNGTAAARAFTYSRQAVGWTEKLPPLGEFTLERFTDVVFEGTFETGDGAVVRARWKRTGDAWDLDLVEIRRP